MAKFVGREKELEWLQDEFKLVVKDRKPRISVILGDPGQGKTRLVQEFYQKLASDPEWDPEDVDFWPPMYQSRDGDKAKRLEPCPDMQGHQAKGAPRFLWLGVRSEDPTRPNADLSVCKLNGLHMQVQTLATVMEETKSSWKKIQDVAPDALLFALKRGFEFGTGIDPEDVQKVPGKLKDGLERLTESTEEKAQRREVSRARDARLNELVTTMVKGSVSLAKHRPVIIFLDDAQWMDRDLFQFVQDVMKASNCPIHFVATHWTKEWNQGKSFAEADPPRLGKLGYLSTKLTIQDVKLSEANDDEFRELIRDEFPGLEPDQVELLIEKSCHNHEVMRVNLVDLKDHEDWFEGECLDNKLVWLEDIRDWPPDQNERFRQVWKQMGRDIRDSLSVATVQGSRFFRGLVETFIIEFQDKFKFKPQQNPKRVIDEAIDPRELLKAHGETCEFQSTWFRQKASRVREEARDKDGKLSRSFYTYVLQVCEGSVSASFDADLGDFQVIQKDGGDQKDTVLNTGNIVEVEQKLLLLRTSVRSAEACDLDFRIQVDALWCWLLHHQHRYAELQEELKSLFAQDFSGVREQGWLAIACCQKLMETSGLNILYAKVVEPALQAVEMDDHTSHFHVCSALTRALFELGLFDAAQRWNVQAAKILNDMVMSDDAELHVEVAIQFAKICHSTGHYQDGIDRLEVYCPEESCSFDVSGRHFSNALQVVDTLIDLARASGNYDLANQRYRLRIKCYEHVNASAETERHFKGYLQSRWDYARALHEQGQYSQARSEFIAVLDAFDSQSHLPDFQESLLIEYAQICASSGSFVDAMDLIRRAVSSVESDHQQFSDPQSMLRIIDTHRKAGAIESEMGCLESARSHLQKALNIATTLEEKYPLASHAITRINCMFELTKSYELAGEYETALKMYKDATFLAEAHSELFLDPEMKLRHSVSIAKLAGLHEEQGQYRKALALYKKYVESSEYLSRSIPTVDMKLQYLTSLLRVGYFHQEQGDYHQALAMYKKYVELSEGLSEERPTPEMRFHYSNSLWKLGDFHKEKGDLRQALAWYKKYHQSLEKHIKECSTLEIRMEYLISFWQLGYFHQEQGDHRQALAMYKKHLELSKDLSESFPTPELRLIYSESLWQLGDFHQEQGEYGQALKLHSDNFNLYKSLSAACHSTELFWSYSRSVFSYSEVSFQIGKHQQALTVLSEVMQLFENTASQSDSPKHKYECSILADHLAQRFVDGGFYDEGRAAATKSLDLRSDLRELEHRVEFLYRNTKSRYWVAYASMKLGDSQKAQQHFTRCVDERLEVMPDLPHVDSVGSVDPRSDFQRLGLAFQEMGDETMVSRIRNILSDHFDLDVDTFDEEEPV